MSRQHSKAKVVDVAFRHQHFLDNDVYHGSVNAQEERVAKQPAASL